MKQDKNIEHLIFSKKQDEYIEIHGYDEPSLQRRYYNAPDTDYPIEFTDRISEGDTHPFTDAEIVYTGIIDDSKITNARETQFYSRSK